MLSSEQMKGFHVLSVQWIYETLLPVTILCIFQVLEALLALVIIGPSKVIFKKTFIWAYSTIIYIFTGMV